MLMMVMMMMKVMMTMKVIMMKVKVMMIGKIFPLFVFTDDFFRTMQLVFRGHYPKSTSNMPPPLKALFKVFDGWRGEQTFVDMLKLVSGEKEKSTQQKFHVDSLSMLDHLHEQRERSLKGLKRMRMPLPKKSFSCLVSVAPNRSVTSFVTSERMTINIARGDIIIWTGHYSHAGAQYRNPNERLFMHIRSKKISMEDKQFIGYDDDRK
jgi:hypothetical protein